MWSRGSPKTDRRLSRFSFWALTWWLISFLAACRQANLRKLRDLSDLIFSSIDLASLCACMYLVVISENQANASASMIMRTASTRWRWLSDGGLCVGYQRHRVPVDNDANVLLKLYLYAHSISTKLGSYCPANRTYFLRDFLTADWLLILSTSHVIVPSTLIGCSQVSLSLAIGCGVHQSGEVITRPS